MLRHDEPRDNAPRAVLYVLLGVVAACAAVLSWSALHELALVCGFSWWTAPLLPLVVDAGAAAGTLAWLTQAGRARGFGRALALVLLGTSVAGNALGHALAAYAARPHWAIVVAVSAVAPAVLGATVHLAVLAGRRAETATAVQDAEPVVVSVPPIPQVEPPARKPAPKSTGRGRTAPPPATAPTGPTLVETAEERRKRLARERQAARRARLAAEATETGEVAA